MTEEPRMDMSLSLHAASRAPRAGRRFLPAAAITTVAVLAVLMAQLASGGARTGQAAPAVMTCADLLRNISEMRLIDLARDPGAGGLVCSLQRSATD